MVIFYLQPMLKYQIQSFATTVLLENSLNVPNFDQKAGSMYEVISSLHDFQAVFIVSVVYSSLFGGLM